MWQAAQKQCVRVGELIKRPELRRDQEMSGQMNDASISVPFNISEGFLRRRDKETMKDQGLRTDQELRTKDQGRTKN